MNGRATDCAIAAGEPICVVLGDNIIENNICRAVESFQKRKEGAKILLKEVPDAQRFGVAEICGDHVVGIEEKPKNPKSNYGVVGMYFYDSSVFRKIRRLKPSGRGELEITDVNNFYIKEGKLTYEILGGGGPTPAHLNPCSAPTLSLRKLVQTKCPVH